MSLTIYLDDCSDDNRLIHSLTLAGHTVISPRSTNTKDLEDGDHLRYSAVHGYCVYLPITPQIFADYTVIGTIEDIRIQEFLLSTVTTTSARI